MAHVALINPPGIKTLSGLQMHTPNPPIGLAYVAAACREGGHRVTVIDATGEALDRIAPMQSRPDILVQGLGPAEVAERIPADADVVGLGCTFSTLWPAAREILAEVRRCRPDLTIIAGGEHPSAVPEHVLASGLVDICVLGEGEETIVELLDCFDRREDVTGVPGLALVRGDRTVRTPARRRTKAIDAIPLPAWDLFPIQAYIERRQMNGVHQGRAMPILGTRGCPFRCTFCSSPQMWTTAYVTRDVGLLCDEIELYQRRYGATDFHFQDLTAIVSRRWILDFCGELESRGLRITWQLPSGTRSEAIDSEVCAMLAATGCKNLAFAPESGSQQIRDAVQKRVKLEHLLAAVRAALENRLSLSCFFVIGLPQETRATLRETLGLVRRLALMGVHDVGVAKFVPYPGSVLFRELLAAGRVEMSDAFYLSPIDLYGGGGVQTSYAPALSPRQLHRWMIRLYVNFYVLSFLRRPWRTLRTLIRAAMSGREETRYAKWLMDMVRTRPQWKRASAPVPSGRPDREVRAQAAPDAADEVLV